MDTELHFREILYEMQFLKISKNRDISTVDPGETVGVIENTKPEMTLSNLGILEMFQILGMLQILQIPGILEILKIRNILNILRVLELMEFLEIMRILSILRIPNILSSGDFGDSTDFVVPEIPGNCWNSRFLRILRILSIRGIQNIR